MQFINYINLLLMVVFLNTFSNAFPLLNKREIITRIFTASTTNTVTDFYSTTTKVIIAPTVYYIVDGDTTSTSTAIPSNVNPTATPTTTIVLNRKDFEKIGDGFTTSTLSPSFSTTKTLISQDTTKVSTSIDENVSTQVTSFKTTSTLAPSTTSKEVLSSSDSNIFGSSDTNGQVTSQHTTKVSASTDVNLSSQVTSFTSTSTSTPSTTSKEVLSALDGNIFESSEANGHLHETVGSSAVQVVVSTTTRQDSVETQSNTYSTSHNDQQTTSSTTTVAAVTSTSTKDPANSDNSQQATSTVSTKVETTTETTSTASASMLTSIPHALTYSPYNNDGSCKSASDIYSDLQIIKNKGVSHIRVYGTDCNSLETVEPACAKLGIKINQGLWISSAGVDSINEPLQLLLAYGQSNGWDIFDYITVGNEAINSGYCTVSDLINKIKSVKTQLRAAGYTGDVTTSEPPVSFEKYPELCTESEIDFVGINPHSYFDPYCDAAGSGEFVKGQVEIVQKSCGTSKVVITETGYPSHGDVNGKNVPSNENQLIAVQSILDLNSDVTILSFINDYWKNPGPYGIEQYFGINPILP